MLHRCGLVAAVVVLVAVPVLGATGAEAGIDERSFNDRRARISGAYPAGWYRAKRLTNLINPTERLALATFPLRGRSPAGKCAPKRALEEIGPHDAFLWLIEYRPLRGPVWRDIRRRDFPPRPERFRIAGADFEQNASCFPAAFPGLSWTFNPVLGLSRTFRAADRPFGLFLAIGESVGRPRLRQLERILDSLRFGRLQPPPPDPYLNWRFLVTESGDSFRPPPDWAASATRMPRSLPRPRPLFFASNLRLAGLPSRFTPTVPELPSPFPAEALAAFPRKGVLVWVLEEEPGEASADFPPIRRLWPRGRDFALLDRGPVEAAPDLSWRRAAGSFRGYRFSVWIVAGREASEEDRDLALKSASSLALSGCLREPAGDDCPEE